MEPNKHSIGSIIAGILFLIVFIGGMIGIYIGTTDDIRISIISLGAILLAVGIAAISSAVKQKGSKKVLPVTISLVFVLIGAGLITLPLLNMLTGFDRRRDNNIRFAGAFRGDRAAAHRHSHCKKGVYEKGMHLCC